MYFDFFSLIACGDNLKQEDYEKSKRLRDKFKRADKTVLLQFAQFILREKYEDFFEGACLVPVPRSSKDMDEALKPSKALCEALLHAGIGSSLQDILIRSKSLRQSSQFTSAVDRPSLDEHLSSIVVKPELIGNKLIIVVDDVITQGRTSFACAKHLAAIYPDKTIKIFAAVKSSKFDQHQSIIYPYYGIVEFNALTQKVSLKERP